jgi:hypothetical protein
VSAEANTVSVDPVAPSAGERLVTACPTCGAAGLRPFYEVSGVPAHSVMLMHSRDQAILYPRGDLKLGFCAACGFVTNMRFDVSLNEYSPNFEESQHCSPRFDAWARQLVGRLVHDYDIRGKQIVEIGCGKGEFLEIMCEIGGNDGVGIDPGCVPGRLTGPAASRVRFIRDLYSEQYTALPADVLVCRHTLEHIQPTREFVQMMHRAIAGRRDTLVFMEVPDLRRVLREPAFWDMYYEHCSYFTAGTLARLFRECGFEVLELVRDFEDQYIWLTARIAHEGSTHPPLALEEPPAEVAADVARFETRCAEDIASCRERILGFARAGRRPVLWGAGSKCVALMTTLGIGGDVEYVVDINPRKVGRFLPGTGHPVVGPEFLAQYRPGVVVAMNPAYTGEIAATLAALGVDAEVTAV